MLDITIRNEQSEVKIDAGMNELIEQSVQVTLKHCGVTKPVEISVLLVDNERIQVLNKNFRQKDQPTDVLSFYQYEDIDVCEDEVLYLGDIVISCERALRQAKDFGHSLKRELGYLTVHSTLHLLGFDHKEPQAKKEMRVEEKKIMQILNLERE